MAEPREFVVDAGPLSHLAKAGWLSVLRTVPDVKAVVIPDAVAAEIRSGVARHPHLRAILDAEWIEVRELTNADELVAFAEFASYLVANGRNVGESAVLAYAKVHGAHAIIDDGAARQHAGRARLHFSGTLGVLCEAIRAGILTVPLVNEIANHLLETEYRPPLAEGGFERWAREHGLI